MNKELEPVDTDLFLNGLKTKFSYLLQKIQNEKLELLIPPKHLITKNMIYPYFYSNHIIYPSPYDPQMIINLNGKVLQRSDNTFISFIGWKRKLQVNIKEKVVCALSNGKQLEYHSIDNICDDFHYKKPEIDVNKFPMTTFEIGEGYTSYYYQESFSQIEEFCMAEKHLEHFLELMNNHFILTQNNESAYYEEFKQRLNPVIDAFKIAIETSFVVNENIFDQVVCELVQSLIFSKKNLYNNIMDKLIMFSVDEEDHYLKKINEHKTDLKIPCKESQLDEAKETMQEIPQTKTFFEKNLVFQRINAILCKAFEKERNKKDKKDFDGDTFLSLWMYLISQGNINHIFAEINYYYYFHEVFHDRDMSEKSYLATTIKSALNNLKLLVKAKCNPPIYLLNQKIMTIPIQVDISAIQRFVQDSTSSNNSKLSRKKTILKSVEILTSQG